MSAVACCKYCHISSINLEEGLLKTHTNTASEIITGLVEYKGMLALASGIIPVQEKLSFHVAKAICNADPTEGGKKATHKTNSGLCYQTEPDIQYTLHLQTLCRTTADPCHQGSSQPGSPKANSEPLRVM